jgi:alkylation response protein AidB-like acyl-CoA dehydrogenase
LFLVPGDAAGVSRKRLETMDMTRPQAEVTLDGVLVPDDGLLGTEGQGWSILERVNDVVVVALAVEQVGGAQACLDMAVEYAKVRHQFGRPIGSFQAIKHMCADMLVAVESARSAAYYAGWAVSEDNDEVPQVARLAKAYCSEAFFRCAADNIQVHGGIGFTWEHDAHLHLKRAKSSELMFGSPSEHRRRLADLIGL